MPPCWRQMASEKENCIIYCFSPEWVETRHWKIIHSHNREDDKWDALTFMFVTRYYSTRRFCKKKTCDVAVRRLLIFHLNRLLIYVVQVTLHERLVCLFIYRENTRETQSEDHVLGAVSIVFRMNAPCHFCFWQNAVDEFTWHISFLSCSRRLTIFILSAYADEFLMPFYYPLVVKFPLFAGCAPDFA